MICLNIFLEKLFPIISLELKDDSFHQIVISAMFEPIVGNCIALANAGHMWTVLHSHKMVFTIHKASFPVENYELILLTLMLFIRMKELILI